MSKSVKFLFGSKSKLPQTANQYALLFTETGELFKGAGDDKPLIPYGSVLYGYTNLTDLQAKQPVGIIGKLYLTSENKLYTYLTDGYTLVSSSSIIDTFEASKVTYDNSTSTLIGDNVQDAINELDDKIETISALKWEDFSI